MSEERTPSRWKIETVEHAMGSAATAVVTAAVEVGVPVATVDRFEEIAELGRGGMGRVFTAHDRLLGRVVAVKHALTDDAGTLARFAREIQIAARLQHPGVLSVLDAGRDEHGRPFFVMNKVEGQSLERVIGDAEGVRARLAFVGNVAAIVEATAYAHACGVIHRDIKPANILIGRFGESLLIDWGIARISDESVEPAGRSEATSDLTQYGAAIGTPGFMPPEQARGEPAGPTADVYALGSTLFFALTGVRPFAALVATESIAQVANDASPDFAAISDEVPADLVAIVRRAMAPRVADRYQDAGALAADLRAFLAGQLVAAHRYTTRERLARWLRRHRRVVTLAGIAVLAIAIVGVVALRNVIAARDDAEHARSDAEVRLADLLENLALSNPDYALARLAELPAASPVWRHAHGIAATAIHAGAARGLELGTSFAVPEARPDGREIVVIESGWRALRFIEPSLRGTTTRLSLDTEASRVQWVENGAALLVTTKDRGLLHVDRASLRVRRLEIDPVETLALVASSSLIVADKKLRVLDLAGGTTRELARDVVDATRLQDATLCVTTTGIVVVRDDGAIVSVSSEPGLAEAQPGGRRFAYAVRDTVVEQAWDGAALAERARWQTPSQVARLLYSGDALLARFDGSLYALGPGGPRRLRIDRIPMGTAWQPDGLYALLGNEIAWVTARGAIRLVRGHSHYMSVSVAGDYLLAVDFRGTLRAWRRRDLLHVAELPAAHAIDLAGIGDDALLVTGAVGDEAMRRVWQISATSLESTLLARSPIPDSPLGPTFRCESRGRWLAHAGDAFERPAPLFEAGVEAWRPVGVDVRAVLGCVRDIVGLWLVDAVELRDRHDLSRVIARIAAPDAKGAAFGPGGVLLHRADETFALFDASGHMLRTHAVGTIEAFALDELGRVLYERDGALFLWTRGASRRLDAASPGLRVTSIGAERDSFVVRGAATTLASSTDVMLWVDRDGNVTQALNAGAQPRLSGDRLVTADAKGIVTIASTLDGTIVRLDMPEFEDTATVIGDRLVAFSRSLGIIRAIRLDDVPRDAGELRAWVRSTSNAEIRPGATFATFPSP